MIYIVKVWRAREADVQVVTSSTIGLETAALSTTSTLDQIFTAASATSIKGYLKNVTVVVPEGTVDKIDLVGEDSNGFQNAELEDKPYGMAKISATMVMSGDEVLETYYMGAGTAVSSATYTRYQAGDSTSGKTRVSASFLVNLDDSTDEVNLVLHYAKVIKLGDRKLSGADGHWEQDFEAICLPRNYYEELKD